MPKEDLFYDPTSGNLEGADPQETQHPLCPDGKGRKTPVLKEICDPARDKVSFVYKDDKPKLQREVPGGKAGHGLKGDISDYDFDARKGEWVKKTSVKTGPGLKDDISDYDFDARKGEWVKKTKD